MFLCKIENPRDLSAYLLMAAGLVAPNVVDARKIGSAWDLENRKIIPKL